MIYNILLPYIQKFHFANLLHYITFRSGIAVLLSLGISLYFGPIVIKYCRKLQKYGQPIREIGPDHQGKKGTPTMGGLTIIIATAASVLLLADLTNPYIWISLFVLLAFAILGFIDDFSKVTKNHHKGVSGKTKLLVQFCISLIIFLTITYFSPTAYSNKLTIPFFKNLLIDLGYFYLPFVMIVITGSSNAVNLTDGLDGLVAVPIITTAGAFAIISYVVGNSFYSEYLQLLYIPKAGELMIFCSAIVGSTLGFLWFNSQPAEIFMGDIGSLSLGSVLGVISVITKHEIVLGIVGGLFVIEALSVILQVYYYKYTGGKRIFRMAPLHHHFEKLGWPESKIVIRFWIITVVFALIGLASLKLR